MGNSSSIIEYDKFDPKSFANEYSLNPEQVEALLRIFKTYSTRGAPIPKEVFKSLIHEASATIQSPLFDTESYFSRIFDMLDINHDNTVDFYELVAGLTILSTGTVEQKAELAFRAYDFDGDGFLSRKELKTVIQRSFSSKAKFLEQQGQTSKQNCQGLLPGFGVGPDTPEAQRLQKELEKAVDSVVREQVKKETSSELAAKLLDSFFQADDNKDGKLSEEEWRRHATTNPVIRRFLLPGGFAPPKYLKKEGMNMLPKPRATPPVSPASSQDILSSTRSRSSSLAGQSSGIPLSSSPKSVPMLSLLAMRRSSLSAAVESIGERLRRSSVGSEGGEGSESETPIAVSYVDVRTELDYAKALLAPGTMWKGQLSMAGFGDTYTLQIGPRGLGDSIRGAHSVFAQTEGVGEIEVYYSPDGKTINVDYADRETACTGVMDIFSQKIVGTCTQLVTLPGHQQITGEFHLVLNVKPKHMQMPRLPGGGSS